MLVSPVRLSAVFGSINQSCTLAGSCAFYAAKCVAGVPLWESSVQHTSIQFLGVCLLNQDKCAEEEVLLREAMEGSRAALGEQHLDTLTSVHDLGVCLLKQDKCAGAEVLLRKAMEGS
eukprot:293246-Chlamydomonas_euryale.AAC.1